MSFRYDAVQETSGPLAEERSPRIGPARVSSQTLLGAARELVIVHGAREYRLRLTQNGKLILTA